ncbi:hypothetical protein [Rugamonas aquatica]|uniref:Uncharacterized protein n=1 Tax=Rugamonas aquatica TaxID=2743357 RepID=A0A6A7MYS4_9BURK|nr:hypothetical protein [Rugamonas aquatica]MQA37924.1 hypothetical protein [Rugamonas aquatica]
MKIKISSVASEETIIPLNRFYTKLEDSLNNYFSKNPSELVFMFVIVSVYDDKDENYKSCKGHNKSGKVTDPFSKEKFEYFSIAVPYEPRKVLALTEAELREDLCGEMICSLSNTSVKTPKGFDFDHFVSEVRLALEIYKRAKI